MDADRERAMKMKDSRSESWSGGQATARWATGELPASPLLGLCEALIKYGWCLEQSGGASGTPQTAQSSQAGPVIQL